MFLSANNILHNLNIICNDVEIYIRIRSAVSTSAQTIRRVSGIQKTVKNRALGVQQAPRAPFSVLVVVDVKMPVPAVFMPVVVFIDKIDSFQKLQVVH